MIRGIVFDLDGVLLDSAGCHRAAFQEVLAGFGVSAFDYGTYAGWRTPEVFAAVFEHAGMAVPAEQIAAAAQNKSRLAREKLVATNPVAAECRAVLERLGERYLLALASSGSRANVEWFINANDFARFFRSVLAGGDVVQAKPHPEIYLRSFAALELAPAECAVVEDAVAGIAAARAAGAEVIGIRGTCSLEELLAAGAGRVIDSLGGMLELEI